MATSGTPQISTGKEILIAYYNKKKNLKLKVSDVEFSTPEKITTPGALTNSSIRLFPKLGTPFNGSPKIYYDRVHISYLGTIIIDKGNAIRLYELLDAINLKYNINISEDDVENEILNPTQHGEILLNLQIKPSSVTYYSGDIVYTPNYPDPNSIANNVVDQYGFWSVETSGDDVVISNEGLSAEMNNKFMAVCGIPVTTNKSAWEVTVDSVGLIVGVATEAALNNNPSQQVIGLDNKSWGLNTSTGVMYNNGIALSYCPPLALGTVLTVLLDVKGGLLIYMVGNVIYNVAAIGFEKYDKIYPVMCGKDGNVAKGTANFGQLAMVSTPPADYARGVYTVKPYKPVYSGGGGGDYPAAGTVFAVYCKGFDRYGVFADGNGGATEQIVQGNSSACGAPVTITATLSCLPTSVSIVKGSIVETVYTLSSPLEEVIEFDVGLDYTGNADATFHDALRVKIGSGAYTPISGNKINIPAGDDTFTVRTTLSGGILPLLGDGLVIKVKVNADYQNVITTVGWVTFTVNIQNTNIPPEGLLLSVYCNGFDKTGVYADGVGGTYEEVVEVNSTACGYVPFVTRSVTLQGEDSITFPYETSSVTATVITPKSKLIKNDLASIIDVGTKSLNSSIPGSLLPAYVMSTITVDNYCIQVVINNNDVTNTPSADYTQIRRSTNLTDWEYFPFMFWRETAPINIELVVMNGRIFCVWVGSYDGNKYIAYSDDYCATWNKVAGTDVANTFEVPTIGIIDGILMACIAPNQLRISLDGVVWTTITDSVDNNVLVHPFNKNVFKLDDYYILRYNSRPKKLTNLNTITELVVPGYSIEEHNYHVFNNEFLFVDRVNKQRILRTSDLTNVSEIAITRVDLPDYTFGSWYSGVSRMQEINGGLAVPSRVTFNGSTSDYFYFTNDLTNFTMMSVDGAGIVVITKAGIGYLVTTYKDKLRYYTTTDFQQFVIVGSSIQVSSAEPSKGFFFGGIWRYGTIVDVINTNKVVPTQPVELTINGTRHNTYSIAGEPVPVQYTFTIDPAQPFVIDYKTPGDSSISLEFIARLQNEPAAGTVIGTSCDSNYNNLTTYTNGDGGSYYKVTEYNSVDCGYVLDTLLSAVLVNSGSVDIPKGVTTIKLTGAGSISKPTQYRTATEFVPAIFEEVPFTNSVYNSSLDQTLTFILGIRSIFIFGNYFIGIASDSNGYNGYATYYSANLSDWTLLANEAPFAGLNGLLSNANLSNNSFSNSVQSISLVNKRLLFKDFYYDADLVLTRYFPSYEGASYFWNTNNNNGIVPFYLKISYNGNWFCLLNRSGYFSRSIWLRKFDGGSEPILSSAENWEFRWPTLRTDTRINGTNEDVAHYVEGNLVYLAGPMYADSVGAFSSAGVAIFDLSGSTSYAVTYEYLEDSVEISTTGSLARRSFTNIGRFNGKLYAVSGTFVYVRDSSTGVWMKNRAMPFVLNIRNNNTSDKQAPMKCFEINGRLVIYTPETCIYTEDLVTWTTADLSASPFKNRPYFLFTAADGESFYATDDDKIYISTPALPGDIYVSERAESGKPSKLGLNGVLYEFPGSVDQTPPTPVEYNATLDGLNTKELVYNVPAGGSIAIEYLSFNTSFPAAGTFIEAFCDGFNHTNRYANGLGGTYTTVDEYNSVSCGYVAPIVVAKIVVDKPISSINETDSVTLTYSLSKILPDAVGFKLLREDVTYTAGLISSITYEVTGDSTVYPLTDLNTEIIIPAGITSFKLTVNTAFLNIASNNVVNFDLQVSSNVTAISTNTTHTQLTIAANTSVVQPDKFTTTSIDTNNDSTAKLWGGDRTFYTDKSNILRSVNTVTEGTYYIEVPMTSNDNFSIGLISGLDNFSLVDGTIYPGYTETSYGISSGLKHTNSTPTSYGATWTGKTVALVYDATAGTIGVALDGVYQGNAFTGIPGDMYFSLGVDPGNPTTQTSGYVNFGQTTPKFQPPAFVPVKRVNVGFGNLVELINFVPEPVMADGKITPTTLSAPLTGVYTLDSDGIHIKMDTGVTSMSAIAMTDGAFGWRIIVPTGMECMVGIANSSYDPATPLGSDVNSWAVDGFSTNFYHNNVATEINATPRRANDEVCISYELASGILEFETSDRFYTTTLDPSELGDMFAVIQSTQDGGVFVANFGQLPTARGVNSAFWPGIGIPLVNKPAGMYIGIICEGTTKLVQYADGNGGVNSEVYELSKDCGYVATYDHWVSSDIDWTIYPPETYINSPPVLAILVSKHDLSTNVNGKSWFWVINPNTSTTLEVGVALDNIDIRSNAGAGADSIVFSFENSQFQHNGATSTAGLPDFTLDEYWGQADIGAVYDPIAGTFGIVYKDVVYDSGFTLLASGGNTVRAIVANNSTVTGLNSVSCNFGQSSITAKLPANTETVVLRPESVYTFWESNGIPETYSFSDPIYETMADVKPLAYPTALRSSKTLSTGKHYIEFQYNSAFVGVASASYDPQTTVVDTPLVTFIDFSSGLYIYNDGVEYTQLVDSGISSIFIGMLIDMDLRVLKFTMYDGVNRVEATAPMPAGDIKIIFGVVQPYTGMNRRLINLGQRVFADTKYIDVDGYAGVENAVAADNLYWASSIYMSALDFSSDLFDINAIMPRSFTIKSKLVLDGTKRWWMVRMSYSDTAVVAGIGRVNAANDQSPDQLTGYTVLQGRTRQCFVDGVTTSIISQADYESSLLDGYVVFLWDGTTQTLSITNLITEYSVTLPLPSGTGDLVPCIGQNMYSYDQSISLNSLYVTFDVNNTGYSIPEGYEPLYVADTGGGIG